MVRHPEPDVRPETPGKRPPVVPRDLPDQQAGAHDIDPLDIGGGPPEDEADDGTPDETVPEPDESGTGRRGAPRSGGVRPDQPVPDEPSG
ncbi:hypothetical protein GTY65_08525 [Streptomyces sp. SID8379]|uniref:hypothetical protein n=1 Tax=unclassified Streptomyces TaxID=2593676 RepID=UPI0003758AB6|nr:MULTISPECIES: hypothetical protein [unclassified Streptomyces]MYW64117.1 hypothetical protein [Streptomyces sp. SID8379]